MLDIIRRGFEKTNNIERSTYLWNSMNAIIAACQCPVILMVITRTNGIYDAGVFSIAFAVASLMVHVGLYGIRRFQASDVYEKYSFAEYNGMRFVTCAIMMLSSLAYCIYGLLFKDYDAEKFIIIMMVCYIRCIQAYTDVIHGRMQQKGRLDIATKVSATRYAAEVLAYIVFLIVTHDLLIASIGCGVVSTITMFVTSINSSKPFCELKISTNLWKMKQLAIEGFPIFASLFLNMYISNAPKYAIDMYLTEEIQAIYNLVFMPAFMVGLLANFIFNPILTSYAEIWADSKYNKFMKLVRKQCVVILFITIFGLLAAATIGIPILSLVFSINLEEYRLELCIVMIGGGMLAYSTFFSTVITIMRKQRLLLACYLFIALAAKILSEFLVIKYEIMGAALLYSILMTLLTLILIILIVVNIKKYMGENNIV